MIDAIHPGGAERAVLTLAEAVSQSGGTAWIATLSDTTMDSYPTPPGVQRFSLSPTRLPTRFRSIRTAMTLRGLIREIKPDIAISQSIPTATLLAVSLLGMGQPAVIALQTRADVVMSSHSRISRSIISSVFSHPFRAIAVLTTDARDQVSQWMKHAKIVVIPNALSDALRADIEQAVERYPREPIVLGIGRNHPQKAWPVLIEAFARSELKEAGWKLRLVLNNSKGIPELLHKHNLSGAAEIGNWSSNPSREYARASILGIPTRLEGFPNVALEGLAAGLPVVSTRFLDGSGQIFGDSTALMVDVDDVDAFSQALRALSSNPDMRVDLGTKGRQRSQQFNEASYLASWSRIISDLNRARVGKQE